MPFDIELRDPGTTFDISFGSAITVTVNTVIISMFDELFNVVVLD